MTSARPSLAARVCAASSPVSVLTSEMVVIDAAIEPVPCAA